MEKIISRLLVFALVLLSACDPAHDSDNGWNQPDSDQISADEIADFAMAAQALLGGYELDSLKKITHHTQHDNSQAFGHSKPSVSTDGIEIYSYQPTLKERALEYPSIWYKLKTPDSIDENLSMPKTGSRASSQQILALAFTQARKLVPAAAAKVDAQGYVFSFSEENMRTGSQWLAAIVNLALQDNKTVHISTPTLITGNNIPVLGGMNYCKVFTPTAAAQILVDLANGNHDRIPFSDPHQASLELAAGPSHRAVKVMWTAHDNDELSQQALLFVDRKIESSGAFKGTFAISPGGNIPALSMRGLAKHIASVGYVVWVIEYPNDIAFWETLDAADPSHLRLAELIKQQKTEEIQNLLPSVQAYYSSTSAPVIIFGHSLGGAVLGDVIFGDTNPYDQIILSGVSSFAKPRSQSEVQANNVASFFGSNESIATDNDKLEKVLNELSIEPEPDAEGIYRSAQGNRTLEFIEGFNHFCIISDMNVGMESIRNSDGEGPAPSAAVQTLVEFLIDRKLI